MVRLTEEQLKELDRVFGREMKVVDPRNSMEYVLIPRADYERQLLDQAEEDDLRRFTAAAVQRFFQTLDQEEAESGQAW